MKDDDRHVSKVELEIVRYRELVQTLRSPRMIWRLLLLCLIMVVVIFFGLAMVVLSVKKVYPYSTIETNFYGATTMGTEDKDVIYWLFNTAELWANSGIEVEEGDVITVRSSGSWHTAIHHLANEAHQNKKLSDRYTGSEGSLRQGKKDAFRAQFRLVEDITDGALLMCVFPDDSVKRSANFDAKSNSNFKEYVEKFPSYDTPIYEIGKERRGFKVARKGMLHFAINDIPLTRENIKRMYTQYIDNLSEISSDSQRAEITEWMKSWPLDYTIKKDNTIKMTGRINQIDADLTAKYNNLIKKDEDNDIKYFMFGPHPDDTINDDTINKVLHNELIYYFDNGFIDAWYVDNIGSLLIVVEKRKKP